MGVHAFSKAISTKVTEIERLKFEPVYDDVAVLCVTYYNTVIPTMNLLVMRT